MLRKALIAGSVLVAGAGFAMSLVLGANDPADAAMGAPKGESIQAVTPDKTGVEATKIALETVKPNDHVLGDPDAPVTMIEYASLTCGHCANFHTETLPKLKQNFIETGRVKLVYRHYPLDQRALQASLMAECFSGNRFFSMLEILFKQQNRWARAENPNEHFQKLAGLGGLDTDSYNQCMADDATQDSILSRQLEARNEADINSTPSFIIDGETIAGNPGYEALAEKLRDAGA